MRSKNIREAGTRVTGWMAGCCGLAPSILAFVGMAWVNLH